MMVHTSIITFITLIHTCHQIAYVLADLNHAINFYLYFLTADKFRTRFKDLVLCRSSTPRKKSDATSLADHTQYTRANSTENVALSTRV